MWFGHPNPVTVYRAYAGALAKHFVALDAVYTAGCNAVHTTDDRCSWMPSLFATAFSKESTMDLKCASCLYMINRHRITAAEVSVVDIRQEHQWQVRHPS